MSSPKHDALLDHEYDGIREYDNPLPKWWVWIFWGSFWFAGIYYVYYEFGGGESVAGAYEAEMKAAAEQEAKRPVVAATEESLTKLMSDQAAMGEAQAVYQARCAACHADKGQGLVGPNLTDDSWVHGNGKLMDIYNTVSDGVPAKGMPAWSRQLTPKQMSQIVAFVGQMRGKNIAGKAPEGKKATP